MFGRTKRLTEVSNIASFGAYRPAGGYKEPSNIQYQTASKKLTQAVVRGTRNPAPCCHLANASEYQHYYYFIITLEFLQVNGTNNESMVTTK